jgi:hypothetical protein
MDRHQNEATIDSQKVSTKASRKQLRKNRKNKDATTSSSAITSDSEPEGKEEEKEEDQLEARKTISLEHGEDFNVIVERMQRAATMTLRKTAIMKATDAAAKKAAMEWSCQLDREGILKIWRTPRAYLKTENEVKIHTLLSKYNGSYTAYMSLIEEGNKRKANMLKEGAHIQWEKAGKLITKDIDARARQILREIDRAVTTKNDYIHSDVLHANDQKFPTSVLRTHLEEALDQLLIDQIKDRERAELFRIEESSSEEEPEESEDEEEEKGGTSRNGSRAVSRQDQKKKKKKEGFEGHREVHIDDEFTLSDYKNNVGSMKENIASNPQREAMIAKVKKRSEKRLQRKQHLKQLSEEEELLKTKKMLQLKQDQNQEIAKLSKDLLKDMDKSLLYDSSAFCLACRTRKCTWKSSIDYDVLTKRKNELDEEIERIRFDKHSLVFESTVALSSQLGGNTIYRRQDLIDELHTENSEIELHISLDQIDMELHDAYAHKGEYFESQFLHGYSIMLWTNHARIALESRQSRLVAMTVAKEIVDDILDFMLEGWIFGERQSNYHVLGYVPSIKKGGDGIIHAGQDQMKSIALVINKMKKRAENTRKHLKSDETTRGKMIEKSYEIELQSQNKAIKSKVINNKKEFKHLLNETEQTLKYGIFMLTLMYFRAMVYLRRDKASFEGKNDLLQLGGSKGGVGGKGASAGATKQMTAERMQMINEENRVKMRQKKMDLILAKSKVGDQRRKERETGERKEAITKLQSIIRRQKLEILSVTLLQKVYRGHLGRKAAKRWALKRAELGAMNALLNATAITIQRIYRGHRDRNYAMLKRQEMAQFIALMRVQESQQDEEIYWQTHPWTRFKRNQKEWLQSKLSQYRSKATLGASRLTSEEQAQLEGKSIEEIKRELDGLDDDFGSDFGSESNRTSTKKSNKLGTSSKSLNSSYDGMSYDEND